MIKHALCLDDYTYHVLQIYILRRIKIIKRQIFKAKIQPTNRGCVTQYASQQKKREINVTHVSQRQIRHLPILSNILFY